MLASYGRGGAGNISSAGQATPLSYKDLQTPTLKTTVYTTGRGGTGNMAHNTDAREARLRQDVEPVVRRPSAGAYAGRGGAGNIFHADEIKANKRDHAVDDASSGKSVDFESLASKGKEWLFGRK